jgi:hypothetical protein
MKKDRPRIEDNVSLVLIPSKPSDIILIDL